MKRFILRHRKSMLLQAIRSGSMLSLFVYAVIRILAYEFPMNWIEEFLLFGKILLVTCFLIITATVGSAWVYKMLISFRRKAVR